MEDRIALAEIARYIEEHLDGDLSCAALARRACMGKTKFKESFKSEFGLPPAAYVVEARLRRARELLEGTSLTIAEIARRVGYRKPGAFTEMFRRRTGALPSEARSPRGERPARPRPYTG